MVIASPVMDVMRFAKSKRVGNVKGRPLFVEAFVETVLSMDLSFVMMETLRLETAVPTVHPSVDGFVKVRLQHVGRWVVMA